MKQSFATFNQIDFFKFRTRNCLSVNFKNYFDAVLENCSLKTVLTKFLRKYQCLEHKTEYLMFVFLLKNEWI
jgi:hypothetical protein